MLPHQGHKTFKMTFLVV